MKNYLLAILVLTLSCKGTQKEESKSNSALDSRSPSAAVPAPSLTPGIKEEFMSLVNEHRRHLGLRDLILEEELTRLVEAHSQDMASGKIPFGHSGFSERCAEARQLGGGNWCGENVASGQKTVASAFSSWLNSTGHKSNIESSKATHTGFGFAKSSSGNFYWTQIFLERD